MFETKPRLKEMLAARCSKISSHFKRKINFFPQTKILLTSENLVKLNQAFLSSANENHNKQTVFKQSFSVREIYYRQYLFNSSEYKNLIFPKRIDSNSKTAAILNKLDLKELNNPNSENQLSNYLDQELNHFSFAELCGAVFLIAKFMQENCCADSSWDKILQSINEQCLIRLSNWTGDELVKMIDISMMIPRHLKFKNKLMYKLIKKSSTSHEIVFLFYFFLKRRFSVPKENLFDLHLKTHKILPEINSTDAGIIAEGFCNSFECLQKPDILDGVLQKAIEDVENLDEIPFHSFCKFARIMSNFYYHKGVPEFQKSAIKTALKLGTRSVIVLARTGENVRYLDSDLSATLMREVKDRISELSFFNIERVAYLTTLFNIRDEEFLNLAVNAFKAEELTEKRRRLFLLFLKHLTHFKIYPKNLLDLVFRQDFLVHARSNGMHFISAWWFIYCSLEIEQPDHLTLELTPKARKEIYYVNKMALNFAFPKHNLILSRVKVMLTKHFGDETVSYLKPLPHYLMGLLMRFDKNSKLQPLPEDFVTFNKSHIIRPLNDNHIWMYIIWVHYLDLADISTSVPNLIFLTQLRQLNALGYTVLPVFKKYSVRNISLDDPNIGNYMEDLLNAKLEECCKDEKGSVTN